jgi:hypothetical protein
MPIKKERAEQWSQEKFQLGPHPWIPPDPFNYTIRDYFKFAYFKTAKRKTFTKIFYWYLGFV